MPFLTRALSPAQYGILDVFTSVVVFLSMTLALGLDSALWRYYFQAEDESERRLLVATAVYTQLAIAVVANVGLLLTSDAWGSILTNRHGDEASLRVALLGAPFLIGLGTFTSLFRTRFLILRFNIFAVLQFVLIAVLSLGMIRLGHRNAFGVLAGMSIAYAFLFVVGVALTWTDLRRGWSLRWARTLLRFGLPLVPASIALWSLPVVGRFVVLRVDGPADVALLAVAAKIASVLVLVFGAFQAAWGPFALSIMKHPDSRRTYVNVLTYLLVLGITMATFLTVLAHPLVRLIATASYSKAAPLVVWLAFGSVFGAAYYVTSIGASIAKRPSIIATSLVVAAVVNLVLAIVLTPWVGVTGAAAASCAGLALSAYLPHRLTRRLYSIPFTLRGALPLILLGAAVSIIGVEGQIGSVELDLAFRVGLLAIYFAGLVTWSWRSGTLSRAGERLRLSLSGFSPSR